MSALIGNPLLLTSAPAAGGDDFDGYKVERSLRFTDTNGSSTDGNMKKTFLKEGNRRTWTYSCWMKNSLWNGGWWLIGSGNTYFQVVVDGTQSWIRCNQRTNGGNTWWDSNRELNDPSAWYNIVIAVDFTQSANVDKIKLYINGERDPAAAGPLGKNYRNTNTELLINQAADHFIGSNSNPDGGGALLTDVYFIDGYQLSPAAFGEYSSTGVWSPKDFKLPAPNKGITWSGKISGTQDGSYPKTNAFDGVANTTSSLCIPPSGGTLHFDPDDDITVDQALRIYGLCNGTGAVLLINGVDYTQDFIRQVGSNSYGWATFSALDIGKKIDTTNGIKFKYIAGTNHAEIGAIEVDGVVLRDGWTSPTTRTNPHNGTTWSDTSADNGVRSSGSWSALFNGDAQSSGVAIAQSADTWGVALDNQAITCAGTVGVWTYTGASTPKVRVTNTSGTVTTFSGVNNNAWTDWAYTGTIKKIELGYIAGTGSNNTFLALRIDGHELVDDQVDNSVGLKFNDITRVNALGKDKLNGIIANSTTGLPIYNTDATGDVKETGYRTDSNKANLMLAVPGDSIADVSHVSDLRNSGSAKTLTAQGDAAVSREQSRFYGSSMKFDGTGDYIQGGSSADYAFGTGDFCIEWWGYWNAAANAEGGFFQISGTSGGLEGSYSASLSVQGTSSAYRFYANAASNNTGLDITPYQWAHYALVRHSNSLRLYVNGVGGTAITDNTNYTINNLAIGGYYSTSYLLTGYIQDFRIYKTAKYTNHFKPPNRFDWTVNSLMTSSATAPHPITTTGTFEGGRGADKAFNGKVNGTDYAHAGSGQTCTMSFTAVTGITKLRLNIAKNNTGDNWGTIELNDTDDITSWLQSNHAGVAGTAQWIDVTSQLTGTSLSKLEFSTSGSTDIRIAGIEVNDAILVTTKFIDSSVDSPTNYGTDNGNGGEVRGNYCVLNALDSYMTGVTKGSQDYYNNTGAFKELTGTMGVTSGKWYYEVECYGDDGSGGQSSVGWAYKTTIGSTGPGSVNYAVMFETAGWDQNFSTSKTNRNITVNEGDILGVSLDLDAGTPIMRTWVNGGSQNTINLGGTWSAGMMLFPYVNSSHTGGRWRNFNFGQRPWSHTCPSGYKALCSKNLPNLFDSEDSENDPSKYFDIKKYGGTSASQDIKGVGFQPDLVWIKNLESLYDHAVFDAARGANKRLRPSGTHAEGTDTQTLTSFNADGFTTGTDDVTNKSGDDVVAFMWDAGTAAVSASTDGTITPTAQWKNATAGFSISAYTGTGSAATIGHGLGAKPELIIIKSRDAQSSNQSWTVHHKDVAIANTLILNDSDEAGASGSWNSTAPTNTVFSIGTVEVVNTNAKDYIAYCWTSIPGFSKFGSYDANNQSNGNFINLGFQPHWIMIKRTNGDNNWIIKDTTRYSYNPQEATLLADRTNVESDYGIDIDLLGNGFKLRATDNNVNTSGSNHIYAAFAKHPFKTTRAH